MRHRWAFSLILLAASPAAAGTRTMSCHKPQGVVAETICGSAEYVAMDREIAALTDRADAQLSAGERSQLAESQARYLRQRGGCEWAAHHSAHPGAAIDECIRASMDARVHRLRDVVDRSGSEVTAR